jgi:putative multiple sugar transport system substrate-binding protein
MKKIIVTATALVATAAFALTGCSAERGGDTGSGSGDEAAAGFEAGSTIGVALPDKTSENWVLAGKLVTDGMEEAGFKADVQYAPASNTVAEQQNQIQAMVTNGAKVIIIGAKGGKHLATQVQAAKDAGAYVIAYDRLIENTEAVDYYVAFDNFKVGQLQGQALLDGMKAKKPAGPYNIELFSGSPDDNNAGVFFNGAMDVLKPEIDKGNVVVASKQTDVKQTAIQGWKAEGAQARMDQLLTSTYGSKELDGVLSPNDTLARAIITSIKVNPR